nr:1-deoxy-D-xylulose-5-phosphate synthase [Streptomyces chartreusis]
MTADIAPSPGRTPPLPLVSSPETGTLISTVAHPNDLSGFTPTELIDLASEIRGFLVDAVSRTGGHLGPNLGVVELTIALHRVFESPRDRILFDTGHQAYVHKLLTGRQDFSRLRAKDGLSGYPARSESEHDVIENSHASTALGYADGLAKANHLRGHQDRRVVAVIGDGALTGGMAWEALNNLANTKNSPVVIVINDNQRSYSLTTGGLANHLATLRSNAACPHHGEGKACLPASVRQLHGASHGLDNTCACPSLFENLGLPYIGPVDGHDIIALESALTQARDLRSPVVVHCLTEKGHGYRPAEEYDEDRFHAINLIHPCTGLPVKAAAKDWTSVFGEEMVRLGHDREDIVAITAAMLHPVGLAPFAERFPERVFDVGIAEQHAAVSAAGLATGGQHPVVAVYATFLNRAFDQVIMDVALHRLGVTFVIDRAGITGPDGASHNGMWDMTILQAVPGLWLAAPRDADQLRAQLREAVAVSNAPTVVRYPKGSVGPAVPALHRIGGMDVLRDSGGAASDGVTDVLIVSVGAMAPICLEAAELLAAGGVTSTVVDPRWVKPVDPALPGLAAGHRVVVTVEDNGRSGGVGASIAQALRDAEVNVPLRNFGIPQEFLDHGKREEILAEIGLTGPDIARRTAALLGNRG